MLGFTLAIMWPMSLPNIYDMYPSYLINTEYSHCQKKKKNPKHLLCSVCSALEYLAIIDLPLFP